MGTDHVERIELVHNELVEANGSLSARRTDRSKPSMPHCLASIAYRGQPIIDLPFDNASGVVPNAGGSRHRCRRRPGARCLRQRLDQNAAHAA